MQIPGAKVGACVCLHSHQIMGRYSNLLIIQIQTMNHIVENQIFKIRRQLHCVHFWLWKMCIVCAEMVKNWGFKLGIGCMMGLAVAEMYQPLSMTICFKSSKPIQISLCMLMSLSIHLHGLHLDNQYGQTWHLSTQLRSGERTGRRLLWSTTNHCYRSTIRQPGFDLPRHTWSLMNRFQTDQGPCHANLHKWGLAQSPSCDCSQQQTMNHIVDTCPLTKFEVGLNLLYKADDDAVIWLESTAMRHTHTRLTALFQDYPGEPVPER